MGFNTSLGTRLGLVIICLSVLTLPALAQEEGGAGPPVPEQQESVERPAASIADLAPYNTWKEHTGKAQDAVVLMRMELRDEISGETQVRTGTGLLIRCDGFVLVPPMLVSLNMILKDGTPGRAHTDTKNLTMTFAEADGKLPPPQSVFQPRHNYETRDFTALKVNGLHFKALQMLHPRNIREGMPVTIAYAVPDPRKPGAAKAVVVNARVGTSSEPDRQKLRFAFADGPKSVPAGAVVIDAASGLAVGQVPGDAKQVLEDDVVAGRFSPKTFFASFAEVHKAQNAAALLPDPDARAGAEANPETRDANDIDAARRMLDGMVFVPGGPVQLENWPRCNLLSEYKLLYGVEVACTPGFWIDKAAVTTAEYADFLRATRHRPLPAGWTGIEVGGRYASNPVHSVSPKDADTFALWRGKRLVTPVEWLKAKQMRDTRFNDEQQAAVASLGQALTALELEEREIVLMRQTEAQVLARSKGLRYQPGAPYVGPEINALDEERILLVRRFIQEHGFLIFTSAAGANPQDVSIYGVHDVNTNTPEWLLQNEGKQGRDVATKPLVFGFSHFPVRAARQPRQQEPIPQWKSHLNYDTPFSDRMWTILARYFGDDPWQDLLMFGQSGNGFRCAR